MIVHTFNLTPLHIVLVISCSCVYSVGVYLVGSFLCMCEWTSIVKPGILPLVRKGPGPLSLLVLGYLTHTYTYN